MNASGVQETSRYEFGGGLRQRGGRTFAEQLRVVAGEATHVAEAMFVSDPFDAEAGCARHQQAAADAMQGEAASPLISEVEALTDAALRVKFHAPGAKRVDVWMRVFGSGAAFTLVAGRITGQLFTATGLSADTTYEFIIVPRDEHGPGAPSEPATQTTLIAWPPRKECFASEHRFADFLGARDMR